MGKIGLMLTLAASFGLTILTFTSCDDREENKKKAEIKTESFAKNNCIINIYEDEKIGIKKIVVG